MEADESYEAVSIKTDKPVFGFTCRCDNARSSKMWRRVKAQFHGLLLRVNYSYNNYKSNVVRAADQLAYLNSHIGWYGDDHIIAAGNGHVPYADVVCCAVLVLAHEILNPSPIDDSTDRAHTLICDDIDGLILVRSFFGGDSLCAFRRSATFIEFAVGNGCTAFDFGHVVLKMYLVCFSFDYLEDSQAVVARVRCSATNRRHRIKGVISDDYTPVVKPVHCDSVLDARLCVLMKLCRTYKLEKDFSNHIHIRLRSAPAPGKPRARRYYYQYSDCRLPAAAAIV